MARQTFNEINITPLTDIFLVLLIIMMVIAPMLDQQGLNLVVPEYIEAKDIPQESKILNITVTNDNKYMIDEVEVSADELAEVIKSKSKDFPDGLLIQAEEKSLHGPVVHLMDVARNEGVTAISVTQI